jgi:type II secretion system protein J
MTLLHPKAASGSLKARAFTLVETMIAISILSLIVFAIYSGWTAILRASKAGKQVAATVQRSRIALRVLEDSLTSAISHVANQPYYGFLAENGSEPMLSFVARLSKSFPRSGKFGDLDVRRVTFSVENEELVLRQVPLVMEMDIDEKEHPIVLAKHVRDFEMQFWDNRLNDWVDEWKQTNQLPRLVMFTLKLSDSEKSRQAQQEINRIISIPAMAVQPVWQVPRGMPGMGQPPGAVPPGTVPGQPGNYPPGTPGGIPQQPGMYPGQPGRPITPQPYGPR